MKNEVLKKVQFQNIEHDLVYNYLMVVSTL